MQLEANLEAADPYSHEYMQGHWDVPKRVLEGGGHAHIPTCKKLFRDYPHWMLICVFNPMHVHEDKDGKQSRGAWWIFELNPAMRLSKPFSPTFPLLFSKFPDGNVYVDTKVGELVHPEDCYEKIIETLNRKDIFNTERYNELGDNIREANDAEVEREAMVERRLATLREAAISDTVIEHQFDEGERVSGFRSKM